MTGGPSIDGVLVKWGERLFYPANRLARTAPPARLSGGLQKRAAAVRARIQATVVRRAPQVMIKVTGGRRGMGAIAAHLRYIAKAGRLPFEDDRGVVEEGKEALRDLAWQWQYGGSYIGEVSHRREAFNIMLSMPSGTDAMSIQRAAREFARAELAGHRWVMVLHDHQANPHVHLSVRAEGRDSRRLNPRKADLQRWRETFAEKLRGWGIEAEATRQATRGQLRNYEPLWRVKAAEAGRLRSPREETKSGSGTERSRKEAIVAWTHIARGLADSDDAADRALAESVDRYVRATPFALEYSRHLVKHLEQPRLISGREPAPVLEAVRAAKPQPTLAPAPRRPEIDRQR
ncbi:MAG: conjugal transfer protein TraS [Caldimonas sp.]